MSQLSDMAASGRADVIPGYVLSAPTLKLYGEAENAFAIWHVRRMVRLVRPLPPEMQREFIATAMAEVKAGEFTIGMPAFGTAERSARGTRFMFWLCLRVKHPQVTRQQAGELFDAHEDAATEGTLTLLGWGAGDDTGKKKVSRRKRQPPSTGPAPTPSSEPIADSAGSKSVT